MQQSTCNDYGQEMFLPGLKRRPEDPQIDQDERQQLEEQIRELEEAMGID